MEITQKQINKLWEECSKSENEKIGAFEILQEKLEELGYYIFDEADMYVNNLAMDTLIFRLKQLGEEIFTIGDSGYVIPLQWHIDCESAIYFPNGI